MFPFDAEVLASSYRLYNSALWPAQAVALAVALAALWLCVSPGRHGARLLGGVLAAAWLWCGAVFFLGHMASLDFLAPVYGWAFVAEAALLLWLLVWRPAAFRVGSDLPGMVPYGLAVLAVFGLPLLSGLGEAGFAAARIIGLAPGPTVVFTLALLPLWQGRGIWLLLPIPLLWSGVAAVTGWALGVVESLAVPLLAVPAVALLVWRSRRRG